MEKSRFTEEQIFMALRQAEAGTPIAEIYRSLQITEQTFYRWKKKYGGLGTPEIRELRQLREENKKLKQLVADLTLDKHILQESLKKSSKTPGAALVGRVGADRIPGVGASGMSSERICEIEHRVPFQEAAARSDLPPPTPPGLGSYLSLLALDPNQRTPFLLDTFARIHYRLRILARPLSGAQRVPGTNSTNPRLRELCRGARRCTEGRPWLH